MSPERFLQIDNLLQSALDIPEAERQAFLARECAQDADLQKQVEELLGLEGDLTSYFTKTSRSPQEDPEAPLDRPIARLGPYNLVREIGRGGMGSVWLGERADGEFDQQVAVKILKRGLDTDDILRRFQTERRILAQLNHPNIARLFDGGTTADGRPYLVMEYINGQTLDRFASSLGIPERLRLFRTLCDAVQFAHRNLIVHRDLKMSNVLVTVDGTLKLLDFGIAKLLREDGPAEFTTATQMRMLTPAYASPEQIKGDAITTASDVYSLGVILFELLTGKRPNRVATETGDALSVAVRDQPADKPSSVAPDPKQIQGDLDNIVLNALKTEPDRRYASVEAFSEDVRRYLEGRPVAARPDTLGYRVGKFVRRNKVSVAAATLGGLLLAGFAVMTAVQSRRVAAERDKAQRVSAFLTELFKLADPAESLGNKVTARELLDKGAARIQEELKSDPGVQAALEVTMAKAYVGLGLFDKARPLIAHSVASRPSPEAYEQMVELEYYTGRYQQGLDAAQKELEACIAAEGRSGDCAAGALNDVGVMLMTLNRLDEGEKRLEESIRIRRLLSGGDPSKLATSLDSLGLLLKYARKYDRAKPLLEEAIAIWRKSPHDQALLANALNNLASLYQNLNQFDQSEKTYREALALFRKVYGDEHQQVQLLLNNFAVLLIRARRFDEAEPIARESYRLAAKLLPPGHERAMVSNGPIGETLMQLGRYDEARPYLAAFYEGCQNSKQWRCGNSGKLYGAFLERTGSGADAEKAYSFALNLYRSTLPANDDRIREMQETLAGLQQKRSAKR